MNKNFEFQPIGYLRSCYPDKFGTPRQSGIVSGTQSQLEILPHWQPEQALQGLEGYSHAWLVFVFHLNSSAVYHAKVHPPRMQGKAVGVFATRSPHRPNPIGLSLVEILKIEKNTLTLGGVDLIEGTPILDIKPYLPQHESLPQARSGWSTEQKINPIEVRFSPTALEQLQRWQQQSGGHELESVISEILKQDPRPLVYRGYENADPSASRGPYRHQHAVRLYDGDIHFEFLSPELVSVIEIKF